MMYLTFGSLIIYVCSLNSILLCRTMAILLFAGSFFTLSKTERDYGFRKVSAVFKKVKKAKDK